MRRSWWLVLLLVFCLVPRTAIADEIDYLDSFGSGIDSFFGNSINEQVAPEREFNDEYEPVLMDAGEYTVRDAGEGEGETSGVLAQIQAWVSALRVPVTTLGYPLTLLTFLQTFFGHSNAWWGFNSFLLTSIALVFMWWGVRKSIRIIFAAFRKGKASV